MNLIEELQQQLNSAKLLNTPKKISARTLELMKRAALKKGSDYYLDERGNKIKR